MFQGLPRVLMVFGVVVIGIIELAARLPDILLIPQRLQGTAGEYGAKAIQPDVVTAQIAKTQAETKLADTQAQLNDVQQAKVAAETKVAQLQAGMTAAQTAKTDAETRVAQLQAALTASQTAKTDAETRVTQLQAFLTAEQTKKTAAEARVADSQALKNNLDNAGTILTAGALLAGTAYLYNKFGGGSQDNPQQTTQQAKQETTQQPSSSPFELGRTDWLRLYRWGVTLPDDQKAGANYWSAVRNKPPPQSCNNAPPPITAGFLKACETAKQYLADVDKARRSDDGYANGWNAGFKETGGF